MSGFWSRLFIIAAVAIFGFPLLAADKNYSDFDKSTYYHACERLLDSNLSGYYVVTDTMRNFSQLIHLRRLGTTSAYVISTGKFDMRAHGIRELEFGKLPQGWLIGDP